jgi:myo-inositol-1(or 4)-monophosphatase
MQTLLKDTVNITKAAGVAIMNHYCNSYYVKEKSADNPVTDADYASNTLLHENLSALLPEASWLSEETVDRPDRLSTKLVWVIDPIDGTKEFILGIPEFAISVALVENGQPILGVVYNPATEELFYGVKHEGVYFNGKRAQVTKRTQLLGALVDASRSEFKRGEFKPFEDIFKIQIIGSTAYKLARVAVGLSDASWSRGPKNEWDICAGVLLVLEAGGSCVDLNNSPFTFNRSSTLVSGYIANNSFLHDSIISTITPYGAART